MPKNNDPYGWGNYLDVGRDFLSYVDKGKKGSSNDFMSYIDQGMNFGDYTKPPKGKSRKGRPRISNDPTEFGISLQSLGDSIMQSEISTGNALRHGSKGRKKRKERYEKEHQTKLKEKGLKEGPKVGRVVLDKIKLAYNKNRTKNQLKKYYHPSLKPSTSERESIQPEEQRRYKNDEEMR